MSIETNPVGKKMTRRKALGVVGAAGAAAFTAYAAQGVSAQDGTLTPEANPESTTPTPVCDTKSSLPNIPQESIRYDKKSLDPYYLEWSCLNRLLIELDEEYSTGLGFVRREEVKHIIRALQQFGQGQFNFFYKGFYPNGQCETLSPNGQCETLFPNGQGKDLYPKLDPSFEFSPQQVLARTLAQISEDISVIRQIADQRLLKLKSFTHPFLPSLSIIHFLQKTDSLAASALWPGNGSGLTDWPVGFDRKSVPFESDDEDPPTHLIAPDYGGNYEIKTVLTYFTKSVNIRVIPYARVALIGIPYGALAEPHHLFAIPHEVGHFLYWYSHPQILASNADFYGNIRELSGKWKPNGLSGLENWRMEIFADMYAVLRGGPLAILATMEMALEHSQYEFRDYSGHDEHPSAAIRPLIQIKALSNFSEKTSAVPEQDRKKVAEALYEKWRERLYTERYLKLTEPETAAVISEGTGLDPSKPIDLIICELLNAFDNLLMSDVTTTRLIANALDWGWSRPIWVSSGLETRISEYMQQFADFYENIQYFSTANLTPKLPKYSDLHNPWVLGENNEDVIPPLWHDWVVKAKQYVNSGNLSPNKSLNAGKFSENMDPTAPQFPIDYWIRVFGSGGWTTDGPCTDPRHP